MSPDAIQRSALLDIIFENRNKKYGAYELRKAYSHRLSKGIAIAMLVPLLLFAITRYTPGRNAVIPLLDDNDIVRLQHIEDIPPVEPPQPEVRTSPNTTETIAFTKPDIVPDDAPVNPPPRIDDLQDKIIADFTRDGSKDIGLMQPPPAEKIGAEYKPDAPAINAVEDPNMVFTKVEKMPEYPGGVNALQRFLSRHLRPPSEMEPGEKKKLVIRFVVDEAGNVGSFFFTEKGEPVYENEILRVMKKMPQWIPGEQNGKKVRVFFHIPVVFAGEE